MSWEHHIANIASDPAKLRAYNAKLRGETEESNMAMMERVRANTKARHQAKLKAKAEEKNNANS